MTAQGRPDHANAPRLVPAHIVVACLAVLLAVALPTSANPGHVGPEPIETALHLHFAGEDRLAMQPMAPQRFDLPPAPPAGAPACGSALAWTAAFTQVPVTDSVTWTQGLGADAEFGPARPMLTWFVEGAEPGTSEPAPQAPVAMRLRAELRTGDAPGEAQQGRLLAHGTIEAEPRAQTVEGRHVAGFTLPMTWVNRTVAAAEGLHLAIVLDAGIEECRIAPVGVRAYADAGHLPNLRLDVLDPVQIDLLEPRVDGDAWMIVWHASSPWGRFDLADPEPPIVRGPAGQAATPQLLARGEGPSLQTVWSWDANGPNGTYRIDASLQNQAGTATATAMALFQVGSPASPGPAAPEPAGKTSPGGWLPLGLLAGLALAARRD